MNDNDVETGGGGQGAGTGVESHDGEVVGALSGVCERLQ